MGQRLEYTVEQVYRDTNQIRSYAYKLIGEIDPLPETLVWLATLATPPVGYEAHTMTVPNAGQYKYGVGMWAICPICSLDFPQRDMTLVKGKLYCNENGCAQEALLR